MDKYNENVYFSPYVKDMYYNSLLVLNLNKESDKNVKDLEREKEGLMRKKFRFCE